MNLKLPVILGFIFAALADAADSATTTCNDTLQCSGCHCVSANNSMTFAKGDNTTICAHFVTVNNDTGCITAYRAAYPVVVDTFSSIQLTGGQLYFQNYSQNYGYVGIVIQVYGTVMSYNLTYLQLTEFYSSAFSIIIELNNGVVQSAYWDHQCATCSSSDCYQFSLPNGTVIDSICNSPSCISTNDSSSCDPQIYVAWIGTDSNGNQLTSAGMRLSRFDSFSLSDIVSASTISPYVVPTPSNTTNSTNNTNTTDTSGNKTDTNTTTSGNTTNTTDSSGNKTDTNTTTTNTTDTSGNKTDTNTTTTNTTDTSGNKTDTNTTTTNTTDTSGNKTDTNTTTTNTTDTKTTTETSTSTSSSDSSGSSGTTTGSSTSTGTDTSTKGDTTATTGTSTSSGSSTTDTDPTTSTGTDTSTKGDTTTVTKL